MTLNATRKSTARILRFAKMMWTGRRSWFVFENPIVWRNVRATWIQSDPGWWDKSMFSDMTDAESDAFMEAIEGLREGRAA